METSTQNSELILGFLEIPVNSLVLTSKFLPNKVGGKPVSFSQQIFSQAWISPEGLPSQKCESCSYKLSFLMQIFANLDEEEAGLHRMLYVFACLSPECIQTQRSIKVYRGYAPDDQGFMNEDEVDKYYAMDDQVLNIKGLLPKQEEEEPTKVSNMKTKGIVFEEFAIETEVEAKDVTKFYLEQARKLKNKDAKNEDDEGTNALEDAYVSRVAGNIKDQKRIEKMSQQATDDKDEEIEDNGEGWKDEELNELEVVELEKLIETKHNNYAKITA